MKEERYYPGIWIVNDGPTKKSKQHIMCIGELTSLYPYATMAQDIDGLADFLVVYFDVTQKASRADNAKAILKYLSLDEGKRAAYIQELANTKCTIGWDGNLWNCRGKCIGKATAADKKKWPKN